MRYLFGLVMLLTGSLWGADQLIVYPEYPDAIRRNTDYSVEVTQGEVTKRLVVYNHTESSILSSRAHGGDCYRRFCEFAFCGNPVRVDIRVQEDVKSYNVFPTALGLRSTFEGNVISVYLEKPVCFGIQLNRNPNSILSIFADPPENPEEIPAKGENGVLYVDSWLDAPERDGVLTTDASIKEVYIAPGAVLNARLDIRGEGTLVHGRGMILDPMSNIFRYDQQKSHLGFLRVLAPNVTLKDIKLVDARTFNYILSGANSRLINGKALSSMMCTDGISFWGGPNTVVDGAYLYVGDNALVLSGSQPLTIKNVTIGTSCAAIFPQSSFRTPVELENIHVFRCDEGLVNNYYNGIEKPAVKHQTIAIRFKNLTAVDCVLFPWIFQGRNMGTLDKTIRWENVSVPEATGSSDYRSIGKRGKTIRIVNGKDYLFTENYQLHFRNLWIDGQPVTALEDQDIQGKEWVKIDISADSSENTLPKKASCYEMNYTHPYKVYIGHSLQRMAVRPLVWKGKIHLPAEEIRTRLNLPSEITIPQKKGRKTNWILLEDLGKVVSASYDSEKGRIQLSIFQPKANLIEETWPIQSVWQRVPSWMVKLETIQEGENWIYSLSKAERHSGMHTMITDEILKTGNGTYLLTWEAKASEEVSLAAILKSNEKTYMQTVSLTQEWQPCQALFQIDLDGEETGMVSLMIRAENAVENIQLKNLKLIRLPESEKK